MSLSWRSGASGAACGVAGRADRVLDAAARVRALRAGETDSRHAGAMVAAFSLDSALAPARGRIVDRRGARALARSRCACSAGLVLLVVGGALGRAAVALVALSALAGLVAPAAGPVHARGLGRDAGRGRCCSGRSRSTRRARRAR